jgi:hypothetical protein
LKKKKKCYTAIKGLRPNEPQDRKGAADRPGRTANKPHFKKLENARSACPHKNIETERLGGRDVRVTLAVLHRSSWRGCREGGEIREGGTEKACTPLRSGATTRAAATCTHVSR